MPASMRGWRLRISGIVLVAVVILATGPLTAPPVAALDPVTAGTAIFRLFGGFFKRARTYDQINAARDAELAVLDRQEKLAEARALQGIFTGSDLVFEKARILRTRQAIVDLSERLKKMTRDQFNRFLGQTVINLALKHVSGTQGFGKFVNSANGFLNDSDERLSDLLAKVSGSAGDILEDVTRIRDTLDQAN